MKELGSDCFDFDRSTEQAWESFTARLGEVLSMMDASGPLTILSYDPVHDGAWFVRFLAPAPDRLIALLPDSDLVVVPEGGPYTPAAVDHLQATGWQRVVGPAGEHPWTSGSPMPPLADGRLAGVVEDPAHESAFWRNGSQENSDSLARHAVDVLRTVFEVQHPLFLASDVVEEILQPSIPEPPAYEPFAQGHPAPGPAAAGPVTYGSLLRELPAPTAVMTRDTADDEVLHPADAGELSAQVGHVIAGIVGSTPLRDDDGDYAIRVGSTMVFVRVVPDGDEVILFAPIVHDVEGRSRAMEMLNDINAESRWVRFALVRDRVVVQLPVFAKPFVPEHLCRAVAEISRVADGVDDLLADSLRGRTTFASDDE